MRYEDLTGNAYGRLRAAHYAGATPKGQAKWFCYCDCGGTKTAAAIDLKRGNTRSCGCIGAEQRKAAAQVQCHPLSKSQKPREYNAWWGMLRRCYDPKHPSYIRYGARGVGVCDRWRDSFAAFYEDMGDVPTKHTLERRDNEKDYGPDNCRWATMKEQANNRRSNRLLTFDGKTMNISQWSAHLGWHKSVITSRLHNGWTVERALSENPRKRHKP